ncbi:hypothetical protein X805_03830 [Sphaerotilus natans subsp. natans DSM 6575]|uniref:Uncharacterized protein n=1 Tax=Sphaerotilus natans subsp. natans DSM 6575 TaxID=1286631 RepID=A0A059KS44_9BURK|nr:hypothetical protein X805_03830 [Sphaerotilus natans subsp. natans DSM 6575]
MLDLVDDLVDRRAPMPRWACPHRSSRAARPASRPSRPRRRHGLSWYLDRRCRSHGR